VGKITGLFLKELKHAWENVLDLRLSVERVESNPQLVQIVPPNEVVVLISFELTIADVRGMMNLCIPFNSIERIGNKLTANSWVSYGRSETTAQSIRAIGQRLHGSLVEVIVRLADTQISTKDLVELRVGDIITTEKDVHHPLAVCIEGVEKYTARAGEFKGRKAIRIEGPPAPLVTAAATAATAQIPTAQIPTGTPSGAPGGRRS
jgi:flagellar motor switch protein FliM